MIRGTLDIQKLSNPGSTGDVYQVHFEDLAGNTYNAGMSKVEVENLLYNKLGLNMEVDDLHASIDELKHIGRVTLENIETEETELVNSGLVSLPYAG